MSLLTALGAPTDTQEDAQEYLLYLLEAVSAMIALLETISLLN